MALADWQRESMPQMGSPALAVPPKRRDPPVSRRSEPHTSNALDPDYPLRAGWVGNKVAP